MECEEENLVVFRDSSITEASCKLLTLDSTNDDTFNSMTEKTQSTNTTPLANTKSCSRRNNDVNSFPNCKVTLKFKTANTNYNETTQKYQNTSICGK
jgi:hypothetical protein